MTNSQELVPHAFGTPEHAANRAAIVESTRGERPARAIGRSMMEITTLDQAMEFAQAVHASSFVPQAYRGKPDEVLAAIVYGSELGVGPMQALNGIAMIQGRPFLSAQLTQALVRRAGHAIDVIEASPTRAIVSVARQGWAEARQVEVTIEQAGQAGWTRNPVYKSDPAAMLVARATTRAARWHMADVLGGLALEAEAWDELPAASAAPERAQLPVAELAAARRAAAESEPLTLNAVIPHQLAGREEQFGSGDMTVTPADTQLPQPGDLGAWRAAAKERGVTMSDLATWATGPGGISGCHTWTDAAKLDGDDQAKAWGWLLSHGPKTVQA